MQSETNIRSPEGAPDLLSYGSFQRCAALLDYIESAQDRRNGEGLLEWLERFHSLGRVDKRGSAGRQPVIQAHLYVGDELGAQSDIRR